MARIDTLANFLTDVATAIKNKTGKTEETITPANFDTEIESIEAGGKYKPVYVTFRNYTGTSLPADNFVNLDTSLLTDMSYMFFNCANLKSLDVSTLDTTNATDMTSMFSYLPLNTIDLSNMKTGNVTTMKGMFSQSAITSIDLNMLDTHSVTTIYQMFSYATKLTEIDMSGLDMSSLTTTGNAFEYCNLLERFTPFEWKSDNASINAMFYNCKALKEIDLSSFDITISGMYFQHVFYGCSSLERLIMPNVKTPNVTQMAAPFTNCTSLSYMDIRNLDFTKITSTSNIFASLPVDCEIIVKDDSQREWILLRRNDLTNVKTVAELEAA